MSFLNFLFCRCSCLKEVCRCWYFHRLLIYERVAVKNAVYFLVEFPELQLAVGGKHRQRQKNWQIFLHILLFPLLPTVAFIPVIPGPIPQPMAAIMPFRNVITAISDFLSPIHIFLLPIMAVLLSFSNPL